MIGPAAWWHGWSYADAAAGDPVALDRLAGAVAAGHVIECGAQATGGNYSFFTEVPRGRLASRSPRWPPTGRA